MSDTANTGSTEGTEGATPAEVPEGTETPTVEDLLAKVEDLTKHSRKWEDRAKENFEARKALDALQRETMTEAEKAQADRAEVESRASQAEKDRDDALTRLAAFEIAAEFGLDKADAEAISAVPDPDTRKALAERLAGRSTGTRPNPAQGKRGAGQAATPADAFAAAMSDLF